MCGRGKPAELLKGLKCTGFGRGTRKVRVDEEEVIKESFPTFRPV